MKIVKVKFSEPIFTHFFEVSGKAFRCTSGLPEGSKLKGIEFDEKGGGTAYFEHESFEEVEGIDQAPEVNVEYMAYRMMEEEPK